MKRTYSNLVCDSNYDDILDSESYNHLPSIKKMRTNVSTINKPTIDSIGKSNIHSFKDLGSNIRAAIVKQFNDTNTLWPSRLTYDAIWEQQLSRYAAIWNMFQQLFKILKLSHGRRSRAVNELSTLLQEQKLDLDSRIVSVVGSSKLRIKWKTGSSSSPFLYYRVMAQFDGRMNEPVYYNGEGLATYSQSASIRKVNGASVAIALCYLQGKSKREAMCLEARNTLKDIIDGKKLLVKEPYPGFYLKYSSSEQRSLQWQDYWETMPWDLRFEKHGQIQHVTDTWLQKRTKTHSAPCWIRLWTNYWSLCPVCHMKIPQM
jgi:hypothetical protein